MSTNLHVALAPHSAVHGYSFGDLLSEQARSRPHMLAVIDEGHAYTYSQLEDRVNRLVTVLREKGVLAGDRILWLGQNSFRILELLLAAARVGAMLCPANWRWSAHEIADVLDDLQPSVVFWQQAEIGETLRQVRANANAKTPWICHDVNEGESYETLIATAAAAQDFATIDAFTPLLAIYTAAFTGKSGAALLSHESVLIVAWIAMMGQAIEETSSYLVSGPMFHLGVLMGTLGTFLAGGRNIFIARVEAGKLLEYIHEYRATHGMIPQPTVEQMREVNRDGRYDVTSMFEDNQMSDYRQALVMPKHAPAVRKFGGYGQTEIGGLASLVWMGGSGAGRAAPFIQFKIADDQGRELPAGTVGEIFARGPLVMCGYWNRPEENQRRVVDGWHRTNDLGKRDENGSLIFVGPKAAMIKTGIENVYPAEIETCLRAHPGVADVCVIGVPDPVWDQNVKAIIVRKAGSDEPSQSFIDHCRDRLASYKKPKIIEFTTVLPRAADGSLDRKAVDQKFGGGGYPQVL